MAETVTSKLGTTRAGPRSRVWLEGKRLDAHGFKHGTRFLKQFSKGWLIITPCTEREFMESAKADRGSVAGTPERPIIDITGLIVSSTFKGSHVKVWFEPKHIAVGDA